MKGQLLVAETEHRLDQGRANHLFGRHPFATLPRVGFSLSKQIGVYASQNESIGVERSAHRNELRSARMRIGRRERKLGMVGLSHRGLGLVFQGGLAISRENSPGPVPISIRTASDSLLFLRRCPFPDEN